jgi:putative transposase
LIAATYQVRYLFMAMEIGSRRILHVNVTGHPTARSTTQQFREILADPYPLDFVISRLQFHFSRSLDQSVAGFGVLSIRTTLRAP